MSDTEKFKLSKIDAARRQLDCAIELWFHDGDEVSIHTLAAAAYQILHDINQHLGGKEALFFDSSLVVEEYRREWLRVVKEPVNFFKHADKDPDGAIEFSPFGNITFIAFGMRGMVVLGQPITDAMSAFQDWLTVHRPELIAEAARNKFREAVPVEALEIIRAMTKSEFFESHVSARAEFRARSGAKFPEF